LHWDFRERPVRVVKFLTLVFAAFPVFATSVINFSVEPMTAFKKSYIHEKDIKWQWMFGGEYGWMVSDNFSLGANLSFAYNLEKDKQTSVGVGTDLIHSKERIFMLPVSIFFAIDPIPQNVVHPVAHVVLGYNSVFISNVDYEKTSENSAVKFYDGYYNGFYSKFGADCMFDIGKKTSLFVGPQWQISTTERRRKDKYYVFERKFNGFGLRLGVSVLL